MRIAVIDGQGGGIGKMLVEKLKQQYGNRVSIIALGTNALATAQMMKAGAEEGATGENAILFNAGRVDLITGPMGIVLANAMLGELSPKMAEAIGESRAPKVLIPISKCAVQVAGCSDMGLQQYVDEAVDMIGKRIL